MRDSLYSSDEFLPLSPSYDIALVVLLAISILIAILLLLKYKNGKGM